MQSETRNRSYYIKASLISLVVFITIFVVEVFYKEALFNYSLELIPKMQEGANDRQMKIW